MQARFKAQRSSQQLFFLVAFELRCMLSCIKNQMGNLMSCVLICGAVEVVHVVHSDGHVERLIRPLDSAKIHKPHNKIKPPPTNSLPQADLMRCLSNLGADSAGSSYLLLPIRNAADTSSPQAGVFKYKRFSSFQFYKSAFLSPSQTLKPKASTRKSLIAAPPPRKDQQISQEQHSKKKNHHQTHHGLYDNKNHQHEDRKQLLKDSQPFKVRQEGGVTKLVVSKKYLAHLLSESNMKSSRTSSTSSSSSSSSTSNCLSKQNCIVNSSSAKQEQDQHQLVEDGVKASSTTSSSSRVGSSRPGIWRPALESISETVHTTTHVFR